LTHIAGNTKPIPSQAVTAKAVYFTGPRQVELRDLELKAQGDAVLVHSVLQGISAGTEMLFYRGDFPEGIEGDLPGLSQHLAYPLVYGYSNVGIDERGRRVFGFAPHQTHWFARDEELINLDTDISDEDALFIPNLETAIGIVQDLEPIYGDYIGIAGLGVVGLLAALVLHKTHSKHLLLIDVKEGRRSLADRLGAQFINPARENLGERLRELTGGRGLDRAINVSASSQALQGLIDSMNMEGLIVEASWYGTKPVTLNLGRAFHRKRLTIKSSQVSNLGGRLGLGWNKERRMDLVLQTLKEIKPRFLITDRIPFERAPEAYHLLDTNPENSIQVVLDCSDYTYKE